MPTSPWSVPAAARARRPVGWFLALSLVFVGLLGSAAAQVSSPGRSDPKQVMSITVGGDLVPSIFRIEPIQASPGVPRHDVVCAPRQATQRPVVVCDIRFDQPTKLAGYTVGETADPGKCLKPGDCWTSSLAPIAASGGEVADDSAFLFMLDHGGRDAGTVAREDRDLLAILANAGPKQQIAVATFSQNLKIISDFGADRSRMSADLANIRPDNGKTELYKSAIEGVRALDARHARRKFLVILSDGSANDTAYDAAALVKAATDANVKIVSIGYAPKANDTTKLQGLSKIAADTDGTSFEVLGANQLPAETQKGLLTAAASGYLLTAEAPTNALPPKVDVLLRFDQNRTSLIPIDTATTPSLTGPPPAGGTAALVAPTPSLVDRLTENWPLAAGVVAAVALLVAAVLVLRSRRARRRRDVDPPVPSPSDHRADMPYTPPPRPVLDEPRRLDESRLDAPPIRVDREGDGGRTTPQREGDDLGRTVLAPPPGGEGSSKPITFIEIEEQGRSRRVPISKNLASIGRDPANDIVLPAENVSREHAEIISDEYGGWEIRNRTWRRPAAEGGVNPIEVNGHQIDAETHALRDGDVIRFGNIGKTHLTFRHNAQRSR